VARQTVRRVESRFLIAALIWPALAYFAVHALHDRVQGNWPCFLYPMLAAAAADGCLAAGWTGWREGLRRWSARLAAPVAALLLAAVYLQAFFAPIPLKNDPLARLLAVGMRETAQKLDAIRQSQHARAIVTTDYATLGWLAFYMPGHPPVVLLNEEYRFPDAPALPADLADKPILYVAETRRDRHEQISRHFIRMAKIARIVRARNQAPVGEYAVYRIDGVTRLPLGRMP
jgi:hypothetical protein